MTSSSRKAAFTLIELLVVISIILIASSILYVGVGGGGDGLKLSSAQRILSGVAQGARGQALLKNTRTRLIIYTENNTDGDVEKLLRYVGIVYEDKDNPDTWFAATQGDYLPEGIYFDPDLSASINWPSATMNIEYPRQTAQAVGSGPEFYYYEFNSNGTVTAPDFLNSWLVIRAGTLRPNDSGNLEVDFDDETKENLKSALIFRRVGTTTMVTDPDEISS